MVFVVLTLVTGVAYPLVVTGIAQARLPAQATGSVIERDGHAVGSALLGQPFSDPAVLLGPTVGHRSAAVQRRRLDRHATSRPTNPALAEAVAARVAALRAADPGNAAPVPVDLVTASGSGLDPHISPAAAEYQVARVARARGMDDPIACATLVAGHTEGRTFGLLGEPRVNVLHSIWRWTPAPVT